VRAACAEIDLAALTHNLSRIQELAVHSKVLAIVKADAYGHGLEAVVSCLANAAKPADAFGVASFDDAERIRALGIQTRIVVLSGFDEEADFPIIQQLNLDCVIHDHSQLDLLEQARIWPHESCRSGDTTDKSQAARSAINKHDSRLRVWLKIDTGMRRLGFLPSEANAAMKRLQALAFVHPDITVMSHFAQADEIGSNQTALQRCQQQLQQFDQVSSSLHNSFEDGTERAVSLANSGATIAMPAAQRTWIRPGGLLYGLSTHPHLDGAALGFKPVMRLRTRLIATKQVQADDYVGYGDGFRAKTAMRIGIAAIGYGDGYPRHAPSGTPVLVDGKSSQTVGRVSMDLLAVDLSPAPDAQVGSDVVLWGPELPIEIIAKAAQTISYELSCGITRRVRFAHRSIP
jgi:alanine racemase